MSRRLSLVSLLLVVALVAALPALGACGSKDAELDPPAQAIQSLLELRYERSTDASAYAEYLSTPDLAAELARASEEETSEAPPTPEWETPYVSAEGSVTPEASSTASPVPTADVVVVWKDRSDYPEWPPATVFALSQLEDGRWVADDARTIGETETIPPPLD